MKSNNDKQNIMKGIIFGTVFGVFLTGSIAVTAITLTSDQVKYTPSNEKFTATNVKEAMDEIYKIAEYEISSDTYFYDSKTSGENIVRYKKIDGKYYLCDKNGKITSETEQEVSGLTLIEYTSASSNNINMGKAAYSDNKFILGDGSTTNEIVNGIFTAKTAGTNINLGFKPKHIFIYVLHAGNQGLLLYYNTETGVIRRSFQDNIYNDLTSLYENYLSVNETGFWYKAYSDGYARETIYYAW